MICQCRCRRRSAGEMEIERPFFQRSIQKIDAFGAQAFTPYAVGMYGGCGGPAVLFHYRGRWRGTDVCISISPNEPDIFRGDQERVNYILCFLLNFALVSHPVGRALRAEKATRAARLANSLERFYWPHFFKRYALSAARKQVATSVRRSPAANFWFPGKIAATIGRHGQKLFPNRRIKLAGRA